MTARRRVAVAGALGRMGSVARAALQETGEYCCGLARTAHPERDIVASLDEVFARDPDVLLDLTTQPSSFEISLAAVSRGIPTVVGASGWSSRAARGPRRRGARKRHRRAARARTSRWAPCW